MSKQSLMTSWLSRGVVLLSVVTCYGTLALIAMLGLLGFSLTLNESLWAGAIVFFALASVFGLALDLRIHHNLWPLLIGCLGAASIVYVMFFDYQLAIEILGFVLLCSAVLWDWKILQRQA
jgi:arsenite methyltransferase